MAATNPNPNPSKRKRNLPGTPDPTADVIALSPTTLLSNTCYTCEVCGKEFRRSQNLLIHRRGHRHITPSKIPLKSSESSSSSHSSLSSEKERRKVYVCPEEGCVYHDKARALGDLTGIKKHYMRKHGERRWGCERCGKSYAVETDWKAHRRVCWGREWECASCGTLFSRKESLVLHRASCNGPRAEEAEGRYGEVVVKANTVNNELLFPSLWGKAVEDKDERKVEGKKIKGRSEGETSCIHVASSAAASGARGRIARVFQVDDFDDEEIEIGPTVD